MYAYNHIKKISKMFDLSISISGSPDFMSLDFDDEMEWKYNTINFPTSEFYSTIEQFDLVLDEPSSPQSQIRNHDCMWSGRCTTHPNECMSSLNKCNTKYVNEKTIQPNLQQHQQNAADKQNQTLLLQQQNQQITSTSTLSIKSMQQLRKQQNVPAGESLLRRKPNSIIRVPNMSTNDFLNNRDVFIVRPDTPLSLDDDPPEFKHDIDLSACTMGSNKTNLLKESPTEIINILKEHLEDEDSLRTPAKVAKYMPSYRPDGLDELIKDMKTLSDFENDSEDDDDDDDDAVESDATNDSFNVSNTMIQLPNTQASQLAAKHQTAYNITQSMHSDHSYTRCKVRVDATSLGVQTPSDSEEEIDVVSVGDKNLPTNPSARDRRALQNKITSRMVKTTTTGTHTIQRRRISNGSSDDSAYSTSKGSPAIASPNAYSPIRTTQPIASRKRVNQQATVTIPQAKRTKICKKINNQSINSNGRISNISTPTTASTPTPTPKRQQSQHNQQNATIDDTIEKRNQHNDMERQRRIGLKNLFETLKQKIPSLCEKERAPKVNILREATLLCNRLTQEDTEYEKQKQRRVRLQQRLKYLREQLAARGMY